MKTILWVFWPLRRSASWKDRVKMAGLFLLLMSGFLVLGIGSWLIEGK